MTARCNFCGGDTAELYDGIRDWEYGVDGSWSYRQCDDCNAVQLSPFPSLDDLKTAYDIDYHGYAAGEGRGRLFSLLYELRARLFERRMASLVEPGSRILDVGCGAGDFLQGLRRMGLRQLTGIDFSADMVKRLQELDMEGYCGTFEDFPAEPFSYDLVAMNNYLEHTLQPRVELEKAQRILRPGGWLVGEVPGFDSWERRAFGRFWGGNHVPRHTYQFSAGFLECELRRAGFEEVRITHQLNTSHLALSIQNYLQRRRPDLRHNPRLKNGRSSYYVPLLLLLIPFNLLAVLVGKSGCTQFEARKPRELA